MTATLEALKSDVDHLRARADVTDSEAMETRQLLRSLKADVLVVKSDMADLKADAKKDIGQLGTQVGDLYSLVAAVPVDIVRIDRNVADIKRDVADFKADIKRDVADLKADIKRDVADLKQGMGAIMRHFGIQAAEETGES
jgi:peptidoglycan hydrolase CwlO-like protein